MKKIILISILLIGCIIAKAQDDKTVTLIVTGQGKTIDEAKTNALRSAIEQAFGTFISSNTKILDNTIIKDEIVSVTNGNIQKFDVLNKTTLPDGSIAVILKATVSVSKLTTFCESKGVKVEFQGGLFAMNMALQELNEKNEKIAWRNMSEIVNELINKCFDYKIDVTDPQIIPYSSNYKIPIKIKISLNDNYKKILNLIYDYSKSISLKSEELESLKKVGKDYFGVIVAKESKNNEIFYFRNMDIVDNILELPWKMFSISLNNFTINNGIENLSMSQFLKKHIFTEQESIFIPVDNICRILTYSDGSLNHNNSSHSSNNQVKIFSDAEDRESEKKYIVLDFDADWRSIYLSNGGSRSEEIISVSTGIQWGQNYKPFKINFYELNDFIDINFDDVRTIEEIKKITEYKIIPLL